MSPCRAPGDWNILARATILLRQSYGRTSVVDRGDRRDDIVMIGTAKGARAVLHQLAHGRRQPKPPGTTEPCAPLEFQFTVFRLLAAPKPGAGGSAFRTWQVLRAKTLRSAFPAAD